MYDVTRNTLVRITDRIRFNFFDYSLNHYLTECNDIAIIIIVIIINTITIERRWIDNDKWWWPHLNVKQSYENTANNKRFSRTILWNTN